MIRTKTDDELIQQYIVEDPYHPGPADVRVSDYYIHVWALAEELRCAEFDLERVAGNHNVPADYVRAAMAYYRRYQQIIDGRIAANYV